MPIWWRRWLWLTAIAVVPVPILFLGPGHVPPLRLMMLGAIAGSVVVLEQASGAVPLLALIFLFQGALYAGCAWVLITAALIAARRAGVAAVGAPAALLIALLLIAASLLPLYRDPYRAAASTTTLLHLYE
ncbi:MAG TPA: hypothetical protein VEB21_01055 [Terriglobales bacterium]|nr:hypothetical protein [Terriglobales bacterium]